MVFPCINDQLTPELSLFLTQMHSFTFKPSSESTACVYFLPDFALTTGDFVRIQSAINPPGVLSGLTLKLETFRAFDMIRKL